MEGVNDFPGGGVEHDHRVGWPVRPLGRYVPWDRATGEPVPRGHHPMGIGGNERGLWVVAHHRWPVVRVLQDVRLGIGGAGAPPTFVVRLATGNSAHGTGSALV